MRLILVALLVVTGCVEASNAPGDGHAPGGGGKDADAVDGGEGGTDVTGSVCNAPLESLNGTAIYVMGSVRAISQNQPAPAPYNTCGGFVAGLDERVVRNWSVMDGKIMAGTMPVETSMVSASDAKPCTYVLRSDQLSSLVEAPGASVICSYALDVALTVP